MSQIARFRRLLLHNHPNTTKGRAFPCSRFSTLTHKEPTPQCTPKETVASSASAVDHSIPTSSTTPPPPPPPEIAEKKPWGFLKFGIFGALTGAVGMAGYATYAYSLEEVDYKTKAIRESPNYRAADDASAFEKFQALVYSTAMKVPAKSIELYLDLRKLIEEHVRGFTEPMSDKLLPDLLPQEQHVFTLVLDLNETLVYSDWKRERGWRTFKRPGVDAFLEHLAQFYEIVVYSDQMAMYVEPIIDRLDQKGCIRYRLSRAATRYQDGKHYRDLSKLNRDPSRILYVSGHALESCLQPENAVPVKPWTLEADDTALLDLIPFLEFVARSRPADIRQVLSSFQGRDIASEFIERSKAHQRRKQEQKKSGLHIIHVSENGNCLNNDHQAITKLIQRSKSRLEGYCSGCKGSWREVEVYE